MQQNTLLESYLRQLKLPTFAQHYAAMAADAARTGLSCERYLLARGFAELAQRDANRVERCIAQAKLPVLKELSQFDWSCVPGVSKTRVLELAQGGSIAHAEPILMIGNPGLGKTHVATGLALAACRQGRRVRFYNVATLVNDLIAAQHELKLSRFLALLGKQELLLLDEFGFIPFSREGANLLFQLCSALYERSAIIITSNLKFGEWKSVLGEEHLTAALLDRLTHRAHILEFLGESFRFLPAAPAGGTSRTAGRGCYSCDGEGLPGIEQHVGASRAAAQVCHTSQGQDERAPTRLPRPPRAALTWRGEGWATRTGSRERGGGQRQTLDRQQDRGDPLHRRGKGRFGNRLGDSVGARRGGDRPQVAPFFISKKSVAPFFGSSSQKVSLVACDEKTSGIPQVASKGT